MPVVPAKMQGVAEPDHVIREHDRTQLRRSAQRCCSSAEYRPPFGPR